MVIIGFAGVVCVYVVLYVSYMAMQAQAGAALPLLWRVQQALLSPEHPIFKIVHLLMLLVLAYVIFDLALSSVRGILRKQRTYSS